MPASFKVSVTTKEATIYSGDVQSFIAPGEAGYLGVLAHHAPLITNIVSGDLILREMSGKEVLIKSTGKGFMDVSRDSVTILLDSASLTSL